MPVASLLKKTMVYLGLVDDEYDDYEDDYEERGSRSFTALSRQSAATGPERDEPDPRPQPLGASRIRALPKENSSTNTPTLRPQSVPTLVRPAAAESAPRVVAPARFGDAKEIADHLKAHRPVIVNLQVADRDLQRRMIDFCSGVTYALSGEMEKVADQVFLLVPSNVTVSDEERQRLQERNFGQH
ncbi:MAG: cell division protein SepF [Acidimicrobiales bacterium]